MTKDYHIIEHQKARCHKNIEFHKSNVILQSIISLLCVAGGAYTAKKGNIVIPAVLTPALATSCSKLAEHEVKRRRYKEILESLERN